MKRAKHNDDTQLSNAIRVKRKRRRSDAGLVSAILSYLETQQDVIDAQRVNSGSVELKSGQWIELAKRGSLDVRGYFRAKAMRWPLPFEIEAKRREDDGGELNDNQIARIATVLKPGNVPFCIARSVTDVIVFLGELRGMAEVRA